MGLCTVGEVLANKLKLLLYIYFQAKNNMVINYTLNLLIKMLDYSYMLFLWK